MKTIKTYKNWLNEAKTDSQFFKTKEEIENWLINIGIKNFNINEDLTVDADNVFIYDKDLEYFPVQFRHINGDFNCGHNYLKSLKGCPKSANGNFIFWQNEITSLEHCPLNVWGYIDCAVCCLTSLVFAPKKPKDYQDNPCEEIYKKLGFKTEAHIKSLLELDPDPAETLRRLENVYPVRYKTIIKNSRELRFKLGIESEDVQNAYNNSKTRGEDFY